jgi:hypothetical protein
MGGLAFHTFLEYKWNPRLKLQVNQNTMVMRTGVHGQFIADAGFAMRLSGHCKYNKTFTKPVVPKILKSFWIPKTPFFGHIAVQGVLEFRVQGTVSGQAMATFLANMSVDQNVDIDFMRLAQERTSCQGCVNKTSANPSGDAFELVQKNVTSYQVSGSVDATVSVTFGLRIILLLLPPGVNFLLMPYIRGELQLYGEYTVTGYEDPNLTPDKQIQWPASIKCNDGSRRRRGKPPEDKATQAMTTAKNYFIKKLTIKMPQIAGHGTCAAIGATFEIGVEYGGPGLPFGINPSKMIADACTGMAAQQTHDAIDCLVGDRIDRYISAMCSVVPILEFPWITFGENPFYCKDIIDPTELTTISNSSCTVCKCHVGCKSKGTEFKLNLKKGETRKSKADAIRDCRSEVALPLFNGSELSCKPQDTDMPTFAWVNLTQAEKECAQKEHEDSLAAETGFSTQATGSLFKDYYYYKPIPKENLTCSLMVYLGGFECAKNQVLKSNAYRTFCDAEGCNRAKCCIDSADRTRMATSTTAKGQCELRRFDATTPTCSENQDCVSKASDPCLGKCECDFTRINECKCRANEASSSLSVRAAIGLLAVFFPIFLQGQ